MFVVDTNVLVYAANEGAPEHEKSRRLLEGWRSGTLPWFLTWGIVYEFLRVVTHPSVFRNPLQPEQAWIFVSRLLDSPALGLLTETPQHREVASAVWGETSSLRGNLVHDAHVAILMREHGVARIYTRDVGFHRFKFLDVVDPLEG